MYALRLLGGFALEGRRGEGPVELPQRRAEALLALLARAGGLGCTRDRVLTLLWPEQDTGHARHNLRGALHAARQALGHEAVVSMGDTLHLDPARLTSDLWEFQDALAEGRLDDAVLAYGGPFLEGFHLSGAPEFERWLDEERARLQGECLAAVRRLAEGAEAAANWREASEWWGRAVALDPYDSSLVVRRIEALARAGDRANAVKEGGAHCALLRSELELEPDESFLQELERIRRGGVTAARQPPYEGHVVGAADPTQGSGGGPLGRSSATPVPVVTDPVVEDRAAPGKPIASQPPGPWRRRGVAIVTAAIALAALALIAPRAPTLATRQARMVNPVRVTTWLSVEDAPSWSPDATVLAFESDRSGNGDVWVAQLGTGQAVNRTADHAGEDLRPTWSPDGRWIAFFSERDGGGYFVMPRVGGSARRIAPWPGRGGYPGAARWSPSGAEVAYPVGQTTEPEIVIVSVATGDARALPLPRLATSNVVSELAWSPDGRVLAYVRALSLVSAITELWLTDISTGRSTRLTDFRHREVSPTWAPDSRALYFVSNRGGTFDLWRFDIDRAGRPRGGPHPVTSGVGMTRAALSADGRRIAYARARTIRNVMRAPILPDRRARWSDVEQLTFEEVDYESLDVAEDGRLLLSSDRSGEWDIYVLEPERGALLPLTTDTAVDAGPRWKPGGEEMVFYSSRSGHREIWIQPLNGGAARQVTRGAREYLYPTWSPTGREIAVQDESPPGISVVDAASGAVRRLTTGGYNGKPDWSPDGRWIAYTATIGSAYAVWRVPAAGGQPEQLTRAVGGLQATPRWSRDGGRIYFLRREQAGDNLWALSVESREEWPVTDLAGRRGRLGHFTLATDGEFLYFTWEESRSDIWVADFLPPR